MILQTLYQQCIKNNVTFFDEFHVVDLIACNNGAVCGVVALELGTGEFHVFHAKATLFATGGWGRVWSVTSNAHSLTGDGVGGASTGAAFRCKTWNSSSSTRPASTRWAS